MKKFYRPIILLLLIFIVLPLIPCSVSGQNNVSPLPTPIGTQIDKNGLEPYFSNDNPEKTSPRTGKLKGVWVSTVLNLDYPSKPGLTTEQMQSEIIQILDGCSEMGFNAVFWQVRPCGDSFYKSNIFPWSEYLTGTQGKDPGFDPLEMVIAEAHARGIEVHAWLNPFRVSRTNHDLNLLAENNPARQHPEWVVLHDDGNIYYDPGFPEVRKLIEDGISEILDNYDVDGIHFDDYFYPDNGMDDSASYSIYGVGQNIADWRRKNIDSLIFEIHTLCQDVNVSFGVSPFGIWANRSNNSLGSDTNGLESYSAHFADTRKWVKEGMIDYVCPQIYWAIGYKVADYAILLDWWADVVHDTGVELYIGHASYRCGNSDSSSSWYGTSQLKKQLVLNESYPEVTGDLHFRYAFFKSYPAMGEFITLYHKGIQLPEDYPKMEVPQTDVNPDSLFVGRPEKDITTSFDKYYILGKCDPAKSLYMNGEPVSNVTSDGYFGVFVSLSNGSNRFEFKQDDKSVTRLITRSGGSSSSPTPLESADIVSSSAYPISHDICIEPGEKITFRCTAPIGATLTVTIAGQTFKLTPSTTKAPVNDGKLYGTNYFYTYTVSKDYAAGKLHTVGRPVYKMTFNGKDTSVSAGGLLKCIGKNAPFYAVVASDAAFIYSKSSTSGGQVGELSKGMTDYITAITTDGAWVRLRSGYWMQRADLDIVEGDKPLSAKLSAAVYTIGEKTDRLTLSSSAQSVSTVVLDENVMTLTIHNSSDAPELTLPEGSLFSALSKWYENGKTYYRLTLKENAPLDGFWLETDNDSIDLLIKRRPKAVDGDKPLSGLRIMLDAGHGGSEKGALGPAGSIVSERVIVLGITKKLEYELESMGAEVILTRTDDSKVELAHRLVLNREAKPDLFLSIHADAVDENTNSSKISGISIWYRQGISKNFSQTCGELTSGILGEYYRGSKYANYYVCRGNYCPSAILECGFMCCPSDYQRLASESDQAKLAKAAARSILIYFSK